MPSDPESVTFVFSHDGRIVELAAPFRISDAGRSGSKRPRQSNDCTIRAAALVGLVPYDEAYDSFAVVGRRSGRSFTFKTWASSNPLPSGQFRWKSFPAERGKRRMTCVEFATLYPTGRFILKTAHHVFACIDGVLIDDRRPEPYRCVYGAWEFMHKALPA